MNLECERLRICPIGDAELEAVMQAEPDPVLRQAYGEMLEGCRREPERRIWYTLWLMERRDGEIVGDLCFKGIAEDGMVEIGYGLRPGCCGKGYMTEAVRALSRWALDQPGVSRVEAETEPENRASQRVLAACGFVPTGTRGEEGPRFVLYREGGQK